MRRTFLTLALAATAVVGCSRASQTSSGSRPSSNLLTREEIATINVDNTYEAVQRLRPAFLRPRSTATVSNELPVVFLDGIRRGGPETLRAIPAREIREIRYLSARDATTRYGMNVAAGVLDVKLIGR